MPRSNYARAPQLLSLRSRAREPQLLSPRATTTEAHTARARALQQENEKPAMRGLRTTTKSSPCSPQVEKAHAQQRRPKADKEKKKEKKSHKLLPFEIGRAHV